MEWSEKDIDNLESVDSIYVHLSRKQQKFVMLMLNYAKWGNIPSEPQLRYIFFLTQKVEKIKKRNNANA